MLLQSRPITWHDAILRRRRSQTHKHALNLVCAHVAAIVVGVIGFANRKKKPLSFLPSMGLFISTVWLIFTLPLTWHWMFVCASACKRLQSGYQFFLWLVSLDNCIFHRIIPLSFHAMPLLVQPLGDMMYWSVTF